MVPARDLSHALRVNRINYRLPSTVTSEPQTRNSLLDELTTFPDLTMLGSSAQTSVFEGPELLEIPTRQRQLVTFLFGGQHCSSNDNYGK